MMKKSPSTEKMQRWADILDADHDGKLKLDTLQKVRPLIIVINVVDVVIIKS